MTIQLTIELSGVLEEHVLDATHKGAAYDSAVEYVRDLIRRDMLAERDRYESFKAELRAAFATPVEECVEVTADDVIARNRRARAA